MKKIIKKVVKLTFLSLFLTSLVSCGINSGPKTPSKDFHMANGAACIDYTFSTKDENLLSSIENGSAEPGNCPSRYSYFCATPIKVVEYKFLTNYDNLVQNGVTIQIKLQTLNESICKKRPR